MGEPYRFGAWAEPGEIVACLDQYGVAIVESVLDDAYLEQLRQQIAPHLAEYQPNAANPFDGSLTKRFGRLMYRIPKARELVRHPLTIALLDVALKRYAPGYHLVFDGVMSLMEGQAQQVLHRDNVYYENPSPPQQLSTLWAVDDFRRENGGTVFTVGSHLWPEAREPEREDLWFAGMPAGSVLLYYGNTIHAGGKCSKGSRTAVSLQYATTRLPQEENQALATPLEVLRTFDDDLLTLLGFGVRARNCGSVDGIHPISFIKQDGKYRPLNPPGSEYSNGTCHMLRVVDEGTHRVLGHYGATLDDP